VAFVLRQNKVAVFVGDDLFCYYFLTYQGVIFSFPGDVDP